MASGNIKGITIQFNGDTTKLDKALREVRDSTKGIDNELKQVNKALKFNPTNVDLWRQKQELLNQKVRQTETNLKNLKDVQRQMDTQKVGKQSEAYRTIQREITTTESKLKNFNKQLREVGNVNLKAASEQFKQWGSSLENAGRQMQGLSTAAAGVVASLGAISYKAGQGADDLNTMSKVYNIGTQDLQKYGYAADLVDVDIDTIAKSHQRLTKAMSGSDDETGAQAEAFERLGVSITDSNGELRNSDDVWQDTIKALGNVENETERDALAMTLMGKSAAELNPLIEDGGETYEKVAETMKKYNLDYVDQETLDKANEFNDQLDTMKLLGSVALAQVGSQLAAYLAPALEKVVDLVGRFADWLSKLDPEVLTIIGAIAGFIAVLAPLLIGLGKVAFGISSIINLVNLMGGAVGALSAGTLLPIIGVIAAVIAIGVLLYKNWDKIKAVAVAVGKKISAVWNSIKTSVSNAVNSIKAKVTGAWNTIKTSTQNAWNAVKDAIVRPFTWAKEKIESIIDRIKSWFPITLGDIFGGIKLPHFDVEWSSITAFGKTIDFPSGFDIDWYKNGGIFDSPSVIGVGEAGAEAVVPLDKFWGKLDNMQTGGDVTINVYAQPGMDVNQLALKVEQRLVQLQKQRNKAYGGI